ncbi:sulfatase-like hydrolase/transferase [bacterium]|nr:sulfatase-like hydrolase/transferase [bacterium]
MKHFILFLVLLGTLLSASAEDPQRPNIILVMADDMGWGDPGFNSMRVTMPDGIPHEDQGWIATPVMDEMAANGLRFDRFYAASAVCSPTRASCLTGRNPFRVGIPFANEGRLGFDETPLSEVLAANGYNCGHFGKWHLGTMTTLRTDSNRGRNGNTDEYSAPWHHGYDFCFATESKVPTYHPYRKTGGDTQLPTSFDDDNFYGTSYWRMPADPSNLDPDEGDRVPVEDVNDEVDGDDSKLIVDQAISYIRESVNDSKPFFVVLWFHTPHKPLVDPDDPSKAETSDSLRDSIEDMDAAIGTLRDELTTLEVRDNTMLWMTSDNGPEDDVDSPKEVNTERSIRSGRYLERKKSLHEGGLRVPGILEWPAMISSGMVTDFPAVTSDYYPTILDYLGLSVPNQKPLDGVSLRPVIEGRNPSRTKPIGFKIDNGKGNVDASSWVREQYKLINDNGTWELYDLLKDTPGEVEKTPLATSDNIDEKDQAVRDDYDAMLAEFNAWNDAVSNDLPYVHSSQPTVTLSTPATAVSASFTVTATFNEVVSQLEPNEIVVDNGEASGLSGSETSWSFTVTPRSNGEVKVHLPEGAVIDVDGNVNGSSNTLSVTFSELSFTDVEFINDDLNLEVTVAPDSFSGNKSFSYKPIEDKVTYNGTDTGQGGGEWVLPAISLGFRYDDSGGAGGAGDGAMVQNGTTFNQRPRAVFYVLDDHQTLTGELQLGLDVFFDDNSNNNPLKFQVELYAWNDGEAAPELSSGGGIANDPKYNVTNKGESIELLGLEILASAHTDAT